jgi:hypothetical protein
MDYATAHLPVVMVGARITHMIEFLDAPTIKSVRDEKQAEQTMDLNDSRDSDRNYLLRVPWRSWRLGG